MSIWVMFWPWKNLSPVRSPNRYDCRRLLESNPVRKCTFPPPQNPCPCITCSPHLCPSRFICDSAFHTINSSMTLSPPFSTCSGCWMVKWVADFQDMMCLRQICLTVSVVLSCLYVNRTWCGYHRCMEQGDAWVCLLMYPHLTQNANWIFKFKSRS